MKNKLIVAALALASGALFVTAQNPPNAPEGAPRGPRMFGGPLMDALDANKDGELDATEISNATAALKKLDKDGDGKLSAEELRPVRPGGGRGPGGPGAPDGRRGGQGGGRPPGSPQ